MHRLPEPDPGVPDTRSPNRYLLWVAAMQWRSMLLGLVWGVIWMVAQALMPAAIGRTLDAGVTGRDGGELWRWCGAVALLGITAGAAGMLRHRCAVTNYLGASYRTMQLTARQATRLGATLPSRIATGDVVAIGTSDTSSIGSTMDVTARAAGAVVSIVVIAVVLLSADVRIGLTVLLGVPVVMALLGPLFKPMLKRQATVRELQGRLTGRANDIVAGLRVLRGIGGEPEFADRYRAESQNLRRAGVQVARVESVMESGQVLLPGLFVVGVTWLSARLAVSKEITPGELVAFYGYAAFLVMPLRTLTEFSQRYLKARVAAGKVIKVLALEHDLAAPDRVAAASAAGSSEGSAAAAVPEAVPAGAGVLADPDTGLVLTPGVLTAVAAADPREAIALADRLGHYAADGRATLDGVALADLPLAEVRRRILVADNDARLFAGVLAEELTPDGAPDDPAERSAALAAALHVAAAEDVVEALPAGLDTRIAERGRSFSGGQQQRLRLARALMADPETLLLVEPTSAVDAHTEARVAERLAAARRGRTTVVLTTSPLMLARAERVAFLKEGRIVAEGDHRRLLTEDPGYRATVTREEEE